MTYYINNNRNSTSLKIGEKKMDYTSNDLLDKIVNGDYTNGREVFSQIMNDKILSELGAKKVEIAKSLLPSTTDQEQSQTVYDKIKNMRTGE
jgi:hypothetical protein